MSSRDALGSFLLMTFIFLASFDDFYVFSAAEGDDGVGGINV